jgi:cytochrome c553
MKRLGLWGVLATIVLVFAGGFVSYFWLPSAQLNSPRSLFAAFCMALGVPQAAPHSTIVVALSPPSDVILTHDLLQPSTLADIGHGATLALRCTPCHGPTGISFADSPNLAGQYATAIYKQLRDFKSGVRSNAIMNPVAQALSDPQMQQIAAYYASRARPAALRAAADPPPIVKWGAPMRNVAPCGSCHGSEDHSTARPWLNGEPAAYLRAQLQAFASGARTNDINGQMRAMVRGMSPAEINIAALYLAGPTGSP